jgi:hypothetical protein
MVRFYPLKVYSDDGSPVCVASEVACTKKVAKICHSHIHLCRLISLPFFQRERIGLLRT